MVTDAESTCRCEKLYSTELTTIILPNAPQALFLFQQRCVVRIVDSMHFPPIDLIQHPINLYSYSPFVACRAVCNECHSGYFRGRVISAQLEPLIEVLLVVHLHLSGHERDFISKRSLMT